MSTGPTTTVPTAKPNGPLEPIRSDLLNGDSSTLAPHVIRAVSRAAHHGADTPPGRPLIPPLTGSSKEEGNLFVQLLTALLARGITDNRYLSDSDSDPTDADPPAVRLNAAILDLVVRLAEDDASDPTASELYEQLQVAFGNLAAKADSTIRKAVDPLLNEAVSAGFLHDPVRDVARADLADDSPAGFWAAVGDAGKERIVNALWSKVLDKLDDELNKPADQSPLVKKLQAIATKASIASEPDSGDQIVVRLASFVSPGTAANTLSRAVDGRIRQAGSVGTILDPVGSSFHDPR